MGRTRCNNSFTMNQSLLQRPRGPQLCHTGVGGSEIRVGFAGGAQESPHLLGLGSCCPCAPFTRFLGVAGCC